MTEEVHGENIVKVVIWQKIVGVRISYARLEYRCLINGKHDVKMKSEL